MVGAKIAAVFASRFLTGRHKINYKVAVHLPYLKSI